MTVETIGDGNPDGTVIGQSGEKVASFGGTPPTHPAALTAALTTITPADAEGTPDYAIAAITNSTPFGFASAQEGITTLYVVKNLQERVAELEARLESLSLIASN